MTVEILFSLKLKLKWLRKKIAIKSIVLHCLRKGHGTGKGQEKNCFSLLISLFLSWCSLPQLLIFKNLFFISFFLILIKCVLVGIFILITLKNFYETRNAHSLIGLFANNVKNAMKELGWRTKNKNNQEIY